MKRDLVLVVAVVGAVVMVVGTTGCSKEGRNSSASSASTSASVPVSGGSDSSAGTSTTKVSIDGKARDLASEVDCKSTNAQGNVMFIEIGNRNRGLFVGLTKTDPPIVRTVQSMGSFDGTTLAYPDQFGAFQLGEAAVTKDGKTYKISGTASGYKFNASVDEAPITMPFDIEVTCP